MSIDWIVAGVVLSAPEAIKTAKANKSGKALSNNYDGLVKEFWVGPDVERKLEQEVMNPENYDQIWELIETYLRKNPIMLTSCWRDCWGFVGRERLQCHHKPGDALRGVTDEVIQQNRKKTVALLATIYGGHALEQAKEIAHSIVYDGEVGKRTYGRIYSRIQDRGPIFPDME